MPRVRTVVRGMLVTVLALVMLAAAAWGYLFLWPLRTPHPVIRLASGSLVIPGARVYVSPDAPVLEGVDVVVTDGRIAAVGKELARPAGARVVPCDGCTVTAGFWNAHVHFTEPKWAADTSAPSWNHSLADMLTSRGFTTVVDLGSDLRTTVSVRRRIESGELAGPQIYTAGGALYPPDGVPFYVRENLPPISSSSSPARTSSTTSSSRCRATSPGPPSTWPIATGSSSSPSRATCSMSRSRWTAASTCSPTRPTTPRGSTTRSSRASSRST